MKFYTSKYPIQISLVIIHISKPELFSTHWPFSLSKYGSHKPRTIPTYILGKLLTFKYPRDVASLSQWHIPITQNLSSQWISWSLSPVSFFFSLELMSSNSLSAIYYSQWQSLKTLIRQYPSVYTIIVSHVRFTQWFSLDYKAWSNSSSNT